MFNIIKNTVKTIVAINVAVTAVTVLADINRRNKKVDMTTVAPQQFPIVPFESPQIAMATKNLLDQPVIAIGSAFSTLSESTQAAIIQHEVGHHVLGHLDNMVALTSYNGVRNIYPLTGNVISIELEADAYAASIVGNSSMVDALKELRELNQLPSIAKKELNLRIKALGGQA